jgi:hypothetical protein
VLLERRHDLVGGDGAAFVDEQPPDAAGDERTDDDVAPGESYRLSDLELASRLSFFLWSQGPDDALLKAATAGRTPS